MTCDEALAALLTAEPRELQVVDEAPEAGDEAVDEAGEGPNLLAEHLRACPTCRRAARLILQGTTRLDVWLGRMPEVDVEAVLARAREDEGEALPGRARTGEVHDVPRRAGRDRTEAPTRRWSRLRWALPVTAAAVLAGVFLVGREAPDDPLSSSPAGPTAPPPARTVAADPSPVEVEVRGGGTAAVFQTDDPDITVIWFFDEGDEG